MSKNQNEFNKNVGKKIKKNEADDLIKNWEKAEKKPATKSSFFGADLLKDFLSIEGVTGLRFHYAMTKEGIMQPVITPEFETGIDGDSISMMKEEGGSYGDASLACPPHCP